MIKNRIFNLIKKSDRMSGNEFMAEMAGFLESGGDAQFMRPSSSKLKLKKEKKEKKAKKEKKSKKEKKEKKSKKSKKSDSSDEGDQWVDSRNG